MTQRQAPVYVFRARSIGIFYCCPGEFFIFFHKTLDIFGFFYYYKKMKPIDESMHNIDFQKIEVGVRFRLFREIIDRSAAQLAEEFGVRQSEITDIEEGYSFPEIIYLHYLYEEYGLNINWLLGKIGTMFNEKDPKNLGEIYKTKPPVQYGESRFDKYVELLELMEIPAIKESITAALLEIKTLLKKQSRERNKKT